MKMNIRNTIILFVVGINLLISCEDFLDRPPLSEITPEEYLWDESELAAYSIARYGVLPTHGNWSFGTFGIDANTDNMAAMDYDNKYAPGQWKVAQADGDWSFDNITQCNYFLNTVIPRWKDGTLTGNQDNVNHYIGEMYFLRAWEYFEKVQVLGDFPIVKTVLPDEMESLIEASRRSPRTEVVRFIISDLDSSINLMLTTSPDGGAKNRLNKACAQLLKSRVALYEATWLKYFKGTAFVPNGSDWPGAEKGYNQDYQFQAGSIDAEIEWLLGEAMSAAKEVADNFSLVTNNGVLQQSTDNDSNPYFDMFSDEDMSGYSEVLLWRQYSKGLEITHNVPVYAQLGNHGDGLTRGMVDGFLMENGLPIYASGSGYHGDDSITSVRQERDGRLWLFLKEPGQVNALYNITAGTHVTATEPVPDITNSSVEKVYTTGYTIRKGLTYDGIYCDNGAGYTGSIVFRAVEAYLNYMEACYEKNGVLDETARQYWVAIRERARVDTDFEKTIAATQLNLEAKNDWGVYSAGKQVDATLYNIRRERRCELMAEGLREMDLKRWRSMDQMISEPYHIEGFKLWGAMQNWYSDLSYGSATANVSDPARSGYLLPYEVSGKELVYDGYRWAMAHYLSPIALEHFLITSENNDVSTSPIYQNPGWPTEANQGPAY